MSTRRRKQLAPPDPAPPAAIIAAPPPAPPAAAVAAAPPPAPAAESEPTPEPIGLECPRCGCRHFYVVYTRPRPGNRIMRKRRCRHCGRPMVTYETTVGASPAA